PGRDHVRELEAAGRRPALGHPAGRVGHPLPLDLPAGHVLTDVVKVQVDRGRVTAGHPLARRRVEGDVDRGSAKGLGADEGKQGLVDVLDHPEDVRLRQGPAATGDRAALRADRPVRAVEPRADWLPDRAVGAAPMTALPGLAGHPPDADAPTSRMTTAA